MSVWSELRKGDRANPGVDRWYGAARLQDLHFSVLVVGDVRCGIGDAQRPRRGTYEGVVVESIPGCGVVSFPRYRAYKVRFSGGPRPCTSRFERLSLGEVGMSIITYGELSVVGPRFFSRRAPAIDSRRLRIDFGPPPS